MEGESSQAQPERARAQLEALRAALADADAALFEQFAHRRRLAAQIGALKRRAGLPTRDFQQEKRVFERARQHADRLGLPRAEVDTLVEALLRSSLTLQERERLRAGARGAGRRALVIGGAGRMGGWLSRFLHAQGYGVEVADPAGPLGELPWRADWREGPLEHDLIAVAAPLRASNEILCALAERQPPGVVFDIGSLKQPVREGLEALVRAGVRTGSLHPMFGPGTALLAGRHVLIVDVGVPEANATLHELFASTLAERVEIDLDTHDRWVAVVLGLSHAVNIAFFSALAERGAEVQQLARIASTTFERQRQVAAEVARENPRLYFEIQAFNPFGTEVLAQLEHAVAALRRAVATRDEEAFCRCMDAGRELFERLRPNAAGPEGACAQAP